MYAVDPRITQVPASADQVVSLFGSLNKPHIAVPGKAAQEVHAHVIGASTGPGVFTLFVHLFLTRTAEAVVYLDHDRLKVPASEYEQAESDALAFVESMGFMIEPLNWRSLSSAQKLELLKTLPCFQRDPKAAAAPADARLAERTETPQQKLARMLAAF